MKTVQALNIEDKEPNFIYLNECCISVILGILGWVQNLELVVQDFLFMEDIKHLCQTISQCAPAKYNGKS